MLECWDAGMLGYWNAGMNSFGMDESLAEMDDKTWMDKYQSLRR